MGQRGVVLVQGEAVFAGSAGVSSADIVNADKMSGRSRKYKIIFSPQKVGLVVLCCYLPNHSVSA